MVDKTIVIIHMKTHLEQIRLMMKMKSMVSENEQ